MKINALYNFIIPKKKCIGSVNDVEFKPRFEEQKGGIEEAGTAKQKEWLL